jgi:hypothetical protein
MKKSIEKAINGKVVDVPDALIDKLSAAGVYIQIQTADEDNRSLEPLCVAWRLPKDIFGRTMDNNKGREERFSCNGYLYNVPAELVSALEPLTKTKKHIPLEPGFFRVAGLRVCLGILFKRRAFKVVPIQSEMSKRREREQKAVIMAGRFIPGLFDDPLDIAKKYYGVQPTTERRFPRGA